MQYLTLQEVLLLHARLIQRTGGAPGVREAGLLESALARPRATFDAVDLYSTLWLKVAALLHGLCQNRPFVDGNKRVALAATAITLELNGLELIASNDEVVVLMNHAASGESFVEDIADWLQAHSRPVLAR